MTPLRHSVLALHFIKTIRGSARTTRHSSKSTSASGYSSTTEGSTNERNPNSESQHKDDATTKAASAQPKKKSVLQQDEELRAKMSGLSGDGGESGIEYEDGQPVSMKRSVRNNMFRYI